MIKNLRNQGGGAIVEFAIVLPLFIIFTFGIIEFGIILFNKALITNASREGARFGILYETPVHTDTEIENTVMTYLDNGNRLINLGGSSATPIISVAPSDRYTGMHLSVTVTYPYDFLLLPNFVTVLPAQLNLSSVTTMRME